MGNNVRQIEKLENNAWHYKNRKKWMENSLKCHWTLKNVQKFWGIKGIARKFLGAWELELKPYLGTSGLLMANKEWNKKKD